MAIKNKVMTRISNADVLKAGTIKYPALKDYTSKGTYDILTTRGYEQLESIDPKRVSEAFALLLRVYLDEINVAEARDPLAEVGLGVPRTNTTFGEYAQRIAINGLKPVSPKFRDLKDGDSVDQQVIRFPKVDQRFFGPNYDFQNWFTMAGDWTLRRVFLSEFGVSDFTAGLMRQLENSYVTQTYLTKLEAVGTAISGSAKFPLKPTQTIEIPWGTTPDVQMKLNAIQAILNLLEAMTDLGANTGSFNEMGFETVNYRDQFVMLVRPGVKNLLMVTDGIVYNPDRLYIDIPMKTVQNFGGLKPFQDAEFTIPLYPVYDSTGAEIGFNTVEDATEATVKNDEVFYKDPHADVLGVIIDKTKIIHTIPNPFTIIPAPFNARGVYQNFFANCPNQTIAVDRLKPMAVLKAVAPTT